MCWGTPTSNISHQLCWVTPTSNISHQVCWVTPTSNISHQVCWVTPTSNISHQVCWMTPTSNISHQVCWVTPTSNIITTTTPPTYSQSNHFHRTIILCTQVNLSFLTLRTLQINHWDTLYTNTTCTCQTRVHH